MAITILYNERPLREVPLDELPFISNPRTLDLVKGIPGAEKISSLKLFSNREIFLVVQRFNVLEDMFEKEQSDRDRVIQSMEGVLKNTEGRIKAAESGECINKTLQFFKTALLVGCLATTFLIGTKVILAGSLAFGVAYILGGLLIYGVSSFVLSKETAGEILQIEKLLKKGKSTGFFLPSDLLKFSGILPLLEAFTRVNRLKAAQSSLKSEYDQLVGGNDFYKQTFESEQDQLVKKVQEYFENEDLFNGIQELKKISQDIDQDVRALQSARESFVKVLQAKNLKAVEDLSEKFSETFAAARKLGINIELPSRSMDLANVAYCEGLAVQAFSDYAALKESIQEISDFLRTAEEVYNGSSEASEASGSEEEQDESDSELAEIKTNQG